MKENKRRLLDRALLLLAGPVPVDEVVGGGEVTSMAHEAEEAVPHHLGHLDGNIKHKQTMGEV